MEELALHILDLAENSLAAGARRLEIRLTESRREDRLRLEITDDGCGMSQQDLRRALDPFFTTHSPRKVGLGLPLLEQAARAAGGELRIESQPGVGTQVTAEFRLSHPDRQPLGDMGATLLALAAGHPEVEILYRHSTEEKLTTFSSAAVRSRLGGVRLNSPAGIAALKAALQELRQPAASKP